MIKITIQELLKELHEETNIPLKSLLLRDLRFYTAAGEEKVLLSVYIDHGDIILDIGDAEEEEGEAGE